MRSFGWRHVERGGKDLFLFLHTAQAPSAEEWAESMAAFAACDARNEGDLERMGFLVVTDGGTPDAQRRADFNRFLGGRVLRTAVVTDQALVRGVVTAIGWFNPRIRVFATPHVTQALEHLGLAASDLPAVVAELTRLQAGMRRVRSLDGLLKR